jgi:glutamyl-tRNA reductase
VLLQTCNRIELYLVSEDAGESEADFFSRLPSRLGTRRDCFYVLGNMEAVTHLFELASGLDSMVLGEDQILSQIEDASTNAKLDGDSRAVLSRLFDVSTGVGKRLRSSGAIPTKDRSVSSFALKFALQKLRGKPKRVLLIGTGKVMKLAARALEDCEIYVATRRRNVAPQFPGARVVSYQQISRTARRCDLIISGTKHDGYVITKEQLQDDLPRVILDLAFPRNIDPRLKAHTYTNLYDLDDLTAEARRGSRLEARHAIRVKSLIEEEADKFDRLLTASRFTPTLANLYRWAEDVRVSETDGALRRLAELSPRERMVVEVMGRRLVSKLLAPAAKFAKDSGEKLSQDERLRILNDIYASGEEGA